MLKCPHECHGIWPLLAMATEDEQRCIVLVGKEFEAARVFEGVDGILLVEADGERLLEAVEILEYQVRYLATFRVLEKEGRLWVFDDLGFASFEGSRRASGARFTVGCQAPVLSVTVDEGSRTLSATSFGRSCCRYGAVSFFTRGTRVESFR